MPMELPTASECMIDDASAYAVEILDGETMGAGDRFLLGDTPYVVEHPILSVRNSDHDAQQSEMLVYVRARLAPKDQEERPPTPTPAREFEYPNALAVTIAGQPPAYAIDVAHGRLIRVGAQFMVNDRPFRVHRPLLRVQYETADRVYVIAYPVHEASPAPATTASTGRPSAIISEIKPAPLVGDYVHVGPVSDGHMNVTGHIGVITEIVRQKVRDGAWIVRYRHEPAHPWWRVRDDSGGGL